MRTVGRKTVEVSGWRKRLKERRLGEYVERIDTHNQRDSADRHRNTYLEGSPTIEKHFVEADTSGDRRPDGSSQYQG
jgi:hypothetical protein